MEKSFLINTIFGNGVIIYSNKTNFLNDKVLINFVKKNFTENLFFITLIQSNFIKVIQNPFKKPESWVNPRFTNFFALKPVGEGTGAVKDLNGVKYFNLRSDDFFMQISNTKKMIKKYDSDSKNSFILNFTKGLGVLEYFLKNKDVEDLVIEDSFKPIYLRFKGFGEIYSNVFILNDEIERLSTKIRLESGRGFDLANPVIDYGFKDSRIRVSGIRPPFTFQKTNLVFRKHEKIPLTLIDLINFKTLSIKQASLLSQLISNRAKILITGHRGSGKTTLLNSLLFELNFDSRIVILEDSPEISVDVLKANFYKIIHIHLKDEPDLIKKILRLGQGVLVLGEVRGAESKSLFEAMRVGASDDVVLGTIHGSDAFDTYERITNDLGIKESSFKSVNFIISLSSSDYDKERKLIEMSEINRFGTFSKKNLYKTMTEYDFGKKKWVNNSPLKSFESLNRFSKRFSKGWVSWNNELKLRELFFSKCVEKNTDLKTYLSLRKSFSQILNDLKTGEKISSCKRKLKTLF